MSTLFLFRGSLSATDSVKNRDILYIGVQIKTLMKSIHIYTPNSGLTHSYALLRECKILLFKMMALNDTHGIKK